jgi:hypothetical protein
MASEVDIANRALQKLGAARIVSLADDSENARECALCYAPVRDAELRAHPWNFSIKRAQLAADAISPIFGYANSFQLPTDCLRLLPPDVSVNYNSLDLQVEGRKILTDVGAPLEIRYVSRIEDPNLFDALFIEGLACKMAVELCEKLTQSNSKGAVAREDYKYTIREAKKLNAFENISAEQQTDRWITCRL